MKQISIGIPRNTRVLRIDRVLFDDRPGIWRLWLSSNPSYTLGTALDLHDDGRIERVVFREDEGDDIMELKGTDR